MKKGINKKVWKVAIPSLCVVSLLMAMVIQYSSKASTEMEATGEAISTISSYEKEGLTTYIGYGYNVVEKDYINADDVSKTNTIFNLVDKETENGTLNGIRNTDIIIDNASNDVETYYISARTVEGFIKEFNTKFGAKAKVTDKETWAPFSMGVAAEASASLNKKKSTLKKSEYVKDVREVKTGTAIWALDECDFYDYLTESFKKDVMTMEPVKLFEKYGTHFLRSVELGGRLEINASIEADSTENLTKAVASFKASIDSSTKEKKNPMTTIIASPKKEEGANNNGGNNGGNNNGGNNNGGNNAENNSEPTNAANEGQEETGGKKLDNASIDSYTDYSLDEVLRHATIELSSDCYGGDAKDFTSYINTTVNGMLSPENALGTEVFAGNTGLGNAYAQWLDTISARPALVDIYDHDSLYPIWKLLDFFAENDENLNVEDIMARKTQLEEAFERYGQDNYDTIMKGLTDGKNDSMFAKMETKITGVKDGYSYNRNNQLDDDDKAIHDGYKLGNVIVTNSANNEDGTMSANSDSLQVMYQLTEDKDCLQLGTTVEKSHTLVYDSHLLGSINGYGKVIDKWMVKEGAYYVQIIYKDQTSVSAYNNNVFKNKHNNDSIVLFETDEKEVDSHGGIDKINVLVLYETMSTGKYGMNKFYNWLEEGTVQFK